MRMLNKIIIIATVLGMTGISGGSFAEVSVNVDSGSSFLSLNVTTKSGDEGVEYWSQTSNLPPEQVLNINGDAEGDGQPVYSIASKNVGEVATAFNDMVYVVWPGKTNGDHYNLVFAFFRSSSWSSIRRVDPLEQTFDDRDPTLVSYKGKLYLSWWKNEGVSKVYYSVYDGNTWSTPDIVSDPNQESKSPILSINGRKELVLEYKFLEGQSTNTNSLILESFDP